jgi:prepilin-type N-terminal cleavage/methylation domain-containing protein
MNLGLKLISSSKKSWIKSPRGSGAFSLIEVIIAAAIVAIIMAALFTGVTATFNLEGVTRENLRATQIIVSRMEGLRLCAWSQDQLFNTNVVPQTFADWFYPLGLQSTTNCGTRYTGTISVVTNVSLNPSATYADKLALITVTVNWTNAQGAPVLHSRSMTTLVAKYGVQNYIYGH